MLRHHAGSLAAILVFALGSACAEDDGELPPDQPTTTVSSEAGSGFAATPNFTVESELGEEFRLADCVDEACWLPIQYEQKLVPGNSLTTEYPYEPNPDNPEGDSIQTVCQSYGVELAVDPNDPTSPRSDVWNMVFVSENTVNPWKETDVSLYTEAPGGRYGWVGDLWLGNQGWRDIPCRVSP